MTCTTGRCVGVILVAAAAACSGGPGGAGFDDSNNVTGNGGADGGASLGGGNNGGSLGGSNGGNNGGNNGGGAACVPDKKNAEIADNHCDDDGDGTVDNVPTCDANLAVDGPADGFAKAIGICETSTSRGFGLVSATYTNGFGRATPPQYGQWGILPRFGSVLVPREGAMLGVLSSGFAREYDSLDGTPIDFTRSPPLDGEYYPTGQAPNGYPKPAAGCIQDNKVNDMIDVKLVIQAPPNAQGFTFDFDFHSSEWPSYVCSPFNDSFIAYLSSSAFNGGTPENISFDSKKNPVSVNNGFFDRCTPNSQTGCGDSGGYGGGYGGGGGGYGGGGGVSACPGGPNELAGTGFGITDRTCNEVTTLGGATGWLTSQAPVKPGETFTIEFMIWDTGDGNLDSSVLIDKFRWVGAPVTATETVRPPK